MRSIPFGSWGRWAEAHPGWTALLCLALTHWIAIVLASVGRFDLWPLALPALAAAVVLGLAAWWRSPAGERGLILGLILLGAALYTPPGEHIPLIGDAAIYPNAGAYIARTGGLSGLYEPLAVIPPEAREPFLVRNTEQTALEVPVTAYAGLVYGAYYLTDLAGPTLSTSRPPLVESWFGLMHKLAGVRAGLYTPALFAILGLILIYRLGAVVWNWQTGLWAALFLGLNYAQIHFGRTPYAEMFGQFWTLAGLLAGVIWLQGRKPLFLALALICWATTWAARLDGLMLLAPTGLLLAHLAARRDRPALVMVVGLLPLLFGLIWLGSNPAYVIATEEIVASGRSWFRPLFLLLLGGMALITPVMWRWREALLVALSRMAPVLAAGAGIGALCLVAWSTLPHPWRVEGVYRDFQEVAWFSSRYLSAGFFWLALLGIGVLAGEMIRRPAQEARLFLGATTLILGMVFFYGYTTGPVYPVSLRRLIGDVIPLMALLAGSGVGMAWPVAAKWRQSGRWAQTALGVAVLTWMVALSWPLLRQHELAGTLNYVQTFHAHLPEDGVFIFERQDEDSWVGWLAAPLYSFHGEWAVLLDTDTPDPAQLAQAVAAWEAAGRTVFVVSQQDPAPSALIPPGYAAELVLQSEWRSSLIGQTRLPPYPPPYWEFVFPVQVYRILSHH